MRIHTKRGLCVWMDGCMAVCVHKHALLADRLEGLRTTLDKQTLCLAHLFTSYPHNYSCSQRNYSYNRSALRLEQKYHIEKQPIGQLLVYFIALLVHVLHHSLFTLVGHCQGWLGLESFTFYFCFFVMIKMGFIIAQFQSYRQTSVCWVI